jgi:hypothetical protein
MTQHASPAGYGMKEQGVMAKQGITATIKAETPCGAVLSAEASAATSVAPTGACGSHQLPATRFADLTHRLRALRAG